MPCQLSFSLLFVFVNKISWYLWSLVLADMRKNQIGLVGNHKRAEVCQAHFIVNRGVWMAPNILLDSNSSRIGWSLLTARTKPPWCPHHFILSFCYSHKHLPSKINTAFHIFVGCRCIPVTHPSTNATRRNKFYTYFLSDRQRKSYHRPGLRFPKRLFEVASSRSACQGLQQKM